jgi:hypothetical protein
LTLYPTYNYGRGVGSIAGTPVTLTKPTSAESGIGITTVSGDITTAIPYNTTGPFSVTYRLTGIGGGGEASTTVEIPIIIDETPENINVPESDELFKNQEPVNAPDYTVTSNYLEVDGIDIPVEVKSDHPIKVDTNRQDNWQDIRQL